MDKGYDIFIEEVIKEIKNQLGKDYKVNQREKIKNNGGSIHGIVISDEIERISPFICTDFYYYMYNDSQDIKIIADEIIRIYNLEHQKCRDYSVLDNLDSHKALESVLFKIINTCKNKNLLSDVPHHDIPDLGLCMVFYLAVKNMDMHGTILVHNNLMDMWHTTEQELLYHALRNTPSKAGYSMMKMSDILEEYIGIGTFKCLPDMCVLTNYEKLYGAGCIFYDGLLKMAAEKRNSGFYILPSSVHEVILVFDANPNKETTRRLKEIVMEINKSELIYAEDFLSDDVYYYDKDKQILSVASVL